MDDSVDIDANGYSWVRVSTDDQMGYAGVPLRFRSVRWAASEPAMVTGFGDPPLSISDPTVRAELEWLSTWSRDDPERVVVLFAPPGHGKTTFAAATIRRTLSVKPRWADWPSLVAAVADSWSDRDTGERAILRPFIGAGFLVVDDFGKEVTGTAGGTFRDWQRRIAYELIDGRHRRQLPTLITSELSSGEMADRLDAAITSRLVHEGRWICLDRLPEFRLAGHQARIAPAPQRWPLEVKP